MRLRNEKYSHRLWTALNPDKIKESGPTFWFWQCIECDGKLNWRRLSASLWRRYEDVLILGGKIKRKKKRFIAKKTQIDIFKMAPLFFVKESGKQEKEEKSCSCRTGEKKKKKKSKQDKNQTTSSAVNHSTQNPFKSWLTAGHPSAIHIHHRKGCQKVIE